MYLERDIGTVVQTASEVRRCGHPDAGVTLPCTPTQTISHPPASCTPLHVHAPKLSCVCTVQRKTSRSPSLKPQMPPLLTTEK